MGTDVRLTVLSVLGGTGAGGDTRGLIYLLYGLVDFFSEKILWTKRRWFCQGLTWAPSAGHEAGGDAGCGEKAKPQ